MSDTGIQHADGRFRVSGELTFATVTRVLERSRRLFTQAGEALEIELGAVERVDSAGLALLIEWMRVAQALDKSIRFFNLPDQMMAIASASDLDSILPLSPASGEPS